MKTEMSNHLVTGVKDGVMYLTLNRPESLNAFSPDMLNGLKASLQQAKEDDEVRVVVISGSGRAFSAGGDVKKMGSKSPLDTYEHLGDTNEVILAIKALEKPVIAAVHGYAAGAGFNLTLASDIILAAEQSKFILSFSKVGLISDGGGLYFLPRLIGTHRAKELLFSAEPISVQEAHSLGFVNHIYPIADFEKEVESFAAKLATGPSVAFGFIKKIADRSLHATLEEILEQERITQATAITTADHSEGVKAFKEKRIPHFTGK